MPVFFLAKFEDILFIWLTTQDLPARVAVTGRVTTSHLIWVRELEFPAVACPADEGLARLVGQQLQKKLPQLDGAAACRAEGREGARLENTTVVGVDTAWGVNFTELSCVVLIDSITLHLCWKHCVLGTFSRLKHVALTL